MEKKLVKCERQDYSKLIAFLSKAFGKEDPEFFKHNIGHLYRKEDEMTDEEIGYNYIMKDGGEICASIAIFPIHLECKLWDKEWSFKLAGIGSVAVDPTYRGQGLMSFMLKEVNAIIGHENYQLSWLQGDRLRYGRYGWYRSGSQYKVSICKDTLTKIRKIRGVEESAVVWGPTKEDREALTKLYEGFSRKAQRSEKDWQDLIQGRDMVMSAEAYMGMSRLSEKRVLEIQGSEQGVLQLLAGYMDMCEVNEIEMRIPKESGGLTPFLLDICDDYEAVTTGKIQVVDVDGVWKEVKEPFKSLVHQHYSKEIAERILDLSVTEKVHLMLGIHQPKLSEAGRSLKEMVPTIDYWYPPLQWV